MANPILFLNNNIPISLIDAASQFPHIEEIETSNNKIFDLQRMVYRIILTPDRIKKGRTFRLVAAYPNNWRSRGYDRVNGLYVETVYDCHLSDKTDSLVCIGNYYDDDETNLFYRWKEFLSDKGYVENEPVNEFFAHEHATIDDEHYMKVLYNEELRNVVLISNDTNAYIWNVAAALSPKIMPWYFADKPCTSEELEFLLAINEGEDFFIEKSNALYDVNDLNNKLQLCQFQAIFKQRKYNLLDNNEKEINRIHSSIDDLIRQMTNLLGKQTELEIARKGLASLDENGAEELLNFFASKQNVEILSVNSSQGTIRFVATADLILYNDDDIETMCSDSSYFHMRKPDSITDDDVNAILKACFATYEIKIPVYSAYELTLFPPQITGIKIDNLAPTSKYAQYSCNPHHEVYNCYGSNLSKAMEFLRVGNIPMAVNQATGCTGLYNYQDGAVTEKFVSRYFYSKKLFQLPNGDFVDYEGAANYLRGDVDNGETNAGN